MLGMSASVVNVESMGRLRLATVEVAVLSVIIVTSLMIRFWPKLPPGDNGDDGDGDIDSSGGDGETLIMGGTL